MYKSGLHSIVHISSPSHQIAKDLATSLLKDDMAVGVCLIPTVSIMYKWKGEVIEDTEALMIVKTRTSKVGDLLNKVNTMSSSPDSDECNIIAIKVENLKVPYFDWLIDSIPENSEYLSRLSP
ncbi:protein CutA homolog [Sipha flava]|uniref:Protein CutA homolog n=1 Tax=Sipha flava TaxID=143950 RepID=A0A8B8FEY4_9HEMI|nr:protein CutA homolog [Sipha flava]XP_025408916.1 protein CutA homolog [Sipha flava]